jgi:single-stranded-DNA-specific exonuclease
MTKAVVRRAVTTGHDFAGKVHPVLARIFASRQLSDASQLEHSLAQLLPYQDLSGIEQAVEVLVAMLNGDRRLLIVADFDADGATSCAVAVRALRLMGATDVRYIVPNRFEYGYGLTPEIVAVAARQEPDLIITVDNGISSIEGVAAARQLGIQVLITDHHLPGAELPEADAIVNPNQAGDRFGSKHLAGVGVVFYLMLALRARLRASGWFGQRGIDEPNLAQLLDLVALGTVADVACLDFNNRILVAQGVARIRRGLCTPGVAALLEFSGRSRERLVATDLGFVLGPRLNAAGRLDDMSLGIACLLEDNKEEAAALARRLDELNRERRVIEQDMKEQALETLDMSALTAAAGDDPLGICLFDERWHQGVIGILASRIKDQLHRPVIVFALFSGTGAATDELKGSARSVPGLHIRDVLETIANQQPGLILKYGGHAMAAGLSLRRGDLDSFRQAFLAELGRHLSREDLRGVIYSDGELEAQHLDLEMAETLRFAAPWGQGFPEPVFDGIFHVIERRTVGGRHLKLQVHLPDDPRCLDAIAFNTTDAAWPKGELMMHLAYRLDSNEFRGKTRAQLVVEHIEPVADR